MKAFNPYDYVSYSGQIYDDADYRVIPCDEWLPPDFEAVMAQIKEREKLTFIYYSPSHHCFFSESSGGKIEIEQVEYWLKIIK